MTFVYDVNEIFNEVLCATFILFNDFFLTVGIQGGIVIFMLPKFAHVVRIDASLLVYARLALDNAIYVTLWLVVERAVRQHTGNGRHIPLWCGDGSVYRLNHTAWLVVSFASFFRFQATLLHLGEQYWLSRVLARNTSPQTLHLRLISNPIAGMFSTFKYALVCFGRNKSHIIYFFVVLQMCCK